MSSFFQTSVFFLLLAAIPSMAAARTADAPFFYRSQLAQRECYSALSPRELRALADKGDTAAMLVLGDAARDAGIDSYAAWYAKAAEHGDAGGEALLGKALLGQKDREGEAMALLESAADKGQVVACQVLGMVALSRQEQVPLQTMERWINTTVAEDAMLVEGLHILSRYPAKSAAGVVSRLREKSEAGDVTAAYMLGYCLAHGIGGPENDAESEKWLAFAAKKGHGRAAWLLYGTFADQERHAEAMLWLLQATENGYTYALRQTADFIDKRGQDRESIPLAAPYLAQAAERGDVDAALLLAERYREGLLPGGKKTAEQWYLRAADLGYSEAWSEILRMYEESGDPEDAGLAAQWEKRVAEEREDFSPEAVTLLTP